MCTVKSQFNDSLFNVKSRFKVQHLVTKMEVHIKKLRFRIKSQIKEPKCADGATFVKSRLYCTHFNT